MTQAKNIALFGGIILGVLGVFALLGMFWQIANSPPEQRATKSPPNVPALSKDQIARIDNDLAFAVGPKNAKVVVVEFLDFKCGFCKQSASTMHRLMTIYKDSSVRFVIRHLPLTDIHPFAMEASQAALCAREQGKFLEMHDALFSHQDELTSLLFPQLAKGLKLESVAFNQCVSDKKYDSLILKDISDSADIGLTGAPTFFINRHQFVGAASEELFKKTIDAELIR